MSDDSKSADSLTQSLTGSARRQSTGVARAIHLLDLVVAEGPLRFAELEELSGIPKATLHRLLNELAEERLILLDERSLTWASGYRILEMANCIWTRSDIRVLARDQLLALNALSGETVEIAVLADTHVVVIDHVESTRSVRHSISVGNREPVYCTGTGKVLLAWCDDKQQKDIISRISFARFTPNTITDKDALLKELSAVSQQGFAVDAEERFLGSHSISAPVVDTTGRAIAALSITAPAFRTTENELASWRKSLVAAAAEISRRQAPRTGGASLESPH
ncbi:MAG: DNA-binding IclR family transcriptional regulator [bacterium]|jgi:DNA-binding IclR family transcriptional regulator